MAAYVVLMQRYKVGGKHASHARWLRSEYEVLNIYTLSKPNGVIKWSTLNNVASKAPV